jgi:hypothetical protein
MLVLIYDVADLRSFQSSDRHAVVFEQRGHLARVRDMLVRGRPEPADGLGRAAAVAPRARKSARTLKVLVEPDEYVAEPLALVVGQEAAVEQFVGRDEDACGDART